ncbi:exported protein of unknown function [Nitrospira tepida]|uniref:Uncharacterized protein n=1 Tax=Nitrospira tepida TaxID=2973512 RepID=A0AA86MYM0_9BACT|nr:hypothetical protein [Nitrospira tepida]CAI4031330.1 exported protein of unknown function [Nitrospira tepida]
MRNWLTVLPALVLLPATLWAGQAPLSAFNSQTNPDSVHKGTMPARVVAVGFGYQRGKTSLIRIRTYDAETGDLLSEERFDLNVVGEDPTKPESKGDRVFAGAAYLDSRTITEFPMRVYDARSGAYLWQGNLNFVTTDSGDPRQHTSAGMWSHSFVRPVGDATVPTVESSLIVQAVDRLSGQPVWRQLFTPKKEQSERVALDSQADRTEADTDNRDYEVIVRSYDRDTEELVWTDRLSTSDVIDEVSGEEPERAQLIPGWPVRPSRLGKLWAWSVGTIEEESGAVYR